MHPSTRHILLIQPLVGIGDMVWHKPWIDALAERYQLTLACKPTTHADMVFHGAPNGFSCLMIERSLRGKKGRHDGLFGFFRLVADFKASGADTVLILHHSPRYALAAYLAAIPIRLGYGSKRQQRFLNSGTYLPEQAWAEHAIQKIDVFAKLNGFGLDAPNWRLLRDETAQEQAKSVLFENQLLNKKDQIEKFLCLGIGAMHPDRQWGAEKFSQLINTIYATRKDLHLVVIAGPEDGDLAQEILALTKPNNKGRTPVVIQESLSVACAILALSKGYVGNDTSLVNLAVCVGVPALGLFSQSKPLTYSPLIKHTHSVAPAEYGQSGIIDKISADAVMQHIDQIWPLSSSKAKSVE